uniref:F-box domain-containing protein n=1 Tax=Maylandia zebra TaxID=106582 RepID=A0A3P9DMN8_9CICH
MAQNPSKLPPEVWNNVFGYLSATEKLNVRATCKYFKTIVDHRSLWKNWTVVLDFKNGSYNRKFWDTLRHRKVSSAVMKSTKVKHWKQLALFLPILTTVVMDQSSQECFSCLKDFPNMRRLVLRSSCSDLLLDISRFPLFLPEKLTYLSMCGVMFPTTSVSKFISVLSQFKNLDSLICHQVGIVGETMWMLHSTLACLPKLKHLSLSGITSKDMAAIAVQLPNLLHLHIDTWPSHLGTRTAEIPRLFPKLKSLKIRHERVPEQDFLQLRHLQHLRYLEILDSTPQLSVLTGKLQALTEFRLQIRIFPYRRDALSCPCVCHVY